MLGTPLAILKNTTFTQTDPQPSTLNHPSLLPFIRPLP
jgi:hypothetical protein